MEEQTMTKIEELAAKEAELKALAPEIEADAEGALEKAEALKAEIETIDAEVKKAEQKAAILDQIGEIKTEGQEESKMNDFEMLTKNAAEVDRSVKGWSVSQHIKAATDVVTGETLADIDRTVAPQPDRIAAKSLFTNATISGNAITFFRQGAYEGVPAVTAEGAKKPQNSTSFSPITLALSKIAAYIKETDEIVTDAPFLASEVRNALLYHLGLVEDATIIGAVANTSGIQGGTYGSGSGSIAGSLVDGILYGIKAIKEKTAYDASVVILNPADMFALLTAVDTNKQYLGGGYFFGAYGNGGYKTPNALWGVPVFESADVTAGSALICAKQAVNVWQKGGVDVKLYEQNEDDAIYNRVTLLAEERIACAVKDLNGVYLLEAE
jgi:HK97 family phage major capsid protein